MVVVLNDGRFMFLLVVIVFNVFVLVIFPDPSNVVRAYNTSCSRGPHNVVGSDGSGIRSIAISLAVESSEVSHVVIVLSVCRSRMQPLQLMVVLAPLVPIGSEIDEFHELLPVSFRSETSIATCL